ncbi:hypothetical protein [Chitinophaga japonensis]|uniref:Sulfotransferase family protein n=1 Tax=Chitinophaga japonensis TaxID=104662 RepID=A0A562T3Y8_CHIJA|nr:hypothetical protein [Chitinophaga japonensis]TWI88249.1 hypothetical protein LX66_2334 [Chitinophaga japonensis]
MQPSFIANWIPYRLCYSGQDGWTAKWLDLGNERMTHPFFDETIQLCRYRQKERSSLESRSSADFLVQACERLDSLEPAAFIFHVSRCGSTLLSQAFTAPAENIVVAEAPLLDEILRAGEKQADNSMATRESWFRAALRLMGQKRNGKETHYIVKLDSWHIHFYECLRAWFPQTPFFFLFRRPDEVIASHEKRRGIQAVPGMLPPALLKTEAPAHYQGDFNRYTARVLEQYYLAMQDICQRHHPGNAFFDYVDGAHNMVDAFSRFAGIPVKDTDQVQERLKYHSKAAQEVFKPEAQVDAKPYFFGECHAAYKGLIHYIYMQMMKNSTIII